MPDHNHPQGTDCDYPCPAFDVFVDSVIHDIQVNGNFTRTWRDADGNTWAQTFESHQAVGPAAIRFRRP